MFVPLPGEDEGLLAGLEAVVSYPGLEIPGLIPGPGHLPTTAPLVSTMYNAALYLWSDAREQTRTVYFRVLLPLHEATFLKFASIYLLHLFVPTNNKLLRGNKVFLNSYVGSQFCRPRWILLKEENIM